MPILFLLLTPLLSSGQTSEAISREVSVFNYGVPSVATNAEAISREVSVFNYGVPSVATNAEAISREVSVFNYGVPSVATNAEAISREVSVFNYGVPSVATNAEAISREVSVFNYGVPSVATNLEAISREVSVFNYGVPSVTTNAEAISREVSVFNYGVPSVGTNVEAISREVSVFNYGVPPVTFSVGSTNILKDEINRVPFTLQTVLDLTNVNFTLQTDDSRLQILGVTPVAPEVISTALGTVISNNHPIAFTLNSAAIPATNHVLAWLNFQGITNLESAVVPLTISDFAANRSSGQFAPGATANGQVILIVNQPLLFLINKPQFGITMYGIPGATYAIEGTTNLAPALWRELSRGLLTGASTNISGLLTNGSRQFFRTEQVGP